MVKCDGDDFYFSYLLNQMIETLKRLLWLNKLPVKKYNASNGGKCLSLYERWDGGLSGGWSSKWITNELKNYNNWGGEAAEQKDSSELIRA